jgi:hypothetical protein
VRDVFERVREKRREEKRREGKRNKWSEGGEVG